MEQYVGLDVSLKETSSLRGGSNGHDPVARQVCVDT